MNDFSRFLDPLDMHATLIAVIEMSQSSWLVAGIVPGVERQPLKKLAIDEHALLTCRDAAGVGWSHRREHRCAPAGAEACSRHTLTYARFGFALRASTLTRPKSGRLTRYTAPPCGGYSTYPRGHRSKPGYAVPARQHLIDPIRPTRRHTAISKTCKKPLYCSAILHNHPR